MTGLSDKAGETQIATLIYCMGDRAEDVLALLNFTEDKRKDFNVVVTKVEGHFIKKRNVIYERLCFSHRVQHEGEPVENFVTSTEAWNKSLDSTSTTIWRDKLGAKEQILHGTNSIRSSPTK